MSNMIDCATTLMLAPGVAQIFYGDETGRRLSDARLNVDGNQAFRSDMNWNDIDEELLDHFRRLGKIRKNNPEIAVGKQLTLDAHTCVREKNGEKVLIKLYPENGKGIGVKGVFPEGAVVRELYEDNRSTVKEGKLEFPSFKNKVAILKIEP